MRGIDLFIYNRDYEKAKQCVQNMVLDCQSKNLAEEEMSAIQLMKDSMPDTLPFCSNAPSKKLRY